MPSRFLRRLLKCLLPALPLTLPLVVAAAEAPLPVLRVCIADEDVPPFTYAHHESQVQQALSRAALNQGWTLSYRVRPWLRCQMEALGGKFDALMPLAPGEQNLEAFVFPGHRRAPNPARALGWVRAVAARKRGSVADWDGQRFSGIQGPVIYLQGLRSLNERLTALDVHSVGTRTSIDMVRMLLAGRGNLAVDIEPRLRQTLTASGAGAQIEILPQTVLKQLVYLAVRPAFYRRHPDLVEALWRDTAHADEKVDDGSGAPPVALGPGSRE